jgi:translation initiation factor 2 alpha subunit (eIF-2alpha)
MNKEVSKVSRFYEKELPDIGEHVMVKIIEVMEFAIIVELIEYAP